MPYNSGAAIDKANPTMQQTATTPAPGWRTATSLFGHKLRVPAADVIGSALIKHGLYDRKGVCMMNAVLSRLHKPIALDIGANIGNHSLAMSTVARQVYSFEPQREVFSILSENIRGNGIDNIEALNLGLSSMDQQLELFIPAADNNGAATLRPELKSDEASSELIQLRKGDDVVNELDLPHLDLIKVDVEGFEVEVLNGLAETIGRFQPVIFMEWDQAITRQEASDAQLFEGLLSAYKALYIGTTYDRDQWPKTLLGRLQRVLYKLRQPRQWLLREANLADNYSNLVLVPPRYLDVLGDMGPVSL
jgi:FkbM family methyltransferase